MEVARSEKADISAVSTIARPAIVTVAPSPVRHPARVLAAGLAIGALSDLLIYGQRIGIGFSLFVLAFVAALFIIYRGEQEADKRSERKTTRRSNLVPLSLLSLGMLFFVVMASLRGGFILQVMNVAVCVRLGCQPPSGENNRRPDDT